MSPKTLAVLAVLLVMGCTASNINVSQSDDDHAGTVSAVTGKETESGARDLDVDVTLPEPPPVTPGMTSVDVRYVFEVTNRGDSPATVKRINIAGAAGAYQIESWSRTYKKTIAPGAKEKLSFLARATVDPLVGTRAPMTLRTEIEYENAQGTQKAAYVRNVGGNVSVGLTKVP